MLRKSDGRRARSKCCDVHRRNRRGTCLRRARCDLGAPPLLHKRDWMSKFMAGVRSVALGRPKENWAMNGWFFGAFVLIAYCWFGRFSFFLTVLATNAFISREHTTSSRVQRGTIVDGRITANTVDRAGALLLYFEGRAAAAARPYLFLPWLCRSTTCRRLPANAEQGSRVGCCADSVLDPSSRHTFGCHGDPVHRYPTTGVTPAPSRIRCGSRVLAVAVSAVACLGWAPHRDAC